MKWIDEDTLHIQNNGSVTLKVDKEIYHDDGWACKSILMKDEYETCYQK